MRAGLCTLLISATLVAGCKSSATTGKALERNPELDALQGMWVAESAERFGRQLPAERASKIWVAFKDETIRIGEGKSDGESASFSIDPEQSPKSIDVQIVRGPDAGKTSLGIYELKGDKLVICWAGPDKPRPTAFTTAGGNAIECLILRRE